MKWRFVKSTSTPATFVVPRGRGSGHLGTQDRERGLIVTGMAVTAAALAVLTVAPNMFVAALAMLVYGGAGGPIDIAMFSMRQRRTDPAWYGRAFAVSMSLNY